MKTRGRDNFKNLAKRAGDDFHLGLVFYAGNRVLPFGPRLRAVPIDALWTGSR